MIKKTDPGIHLIRNIIEPSLLPKPTAAFEENTFHGKLADTNDLFILPFHPNNIRDHKEEL